MKRRCRPQAAARRRILAAVSAVVTLWQLVSVCVAPPSTAFDEWGDDDDDSKNSVPAEQSGGQGSDQSSGHGSSGHAHGHGHGTVVDPTAAGNAELAAFAVPALIVVVGYLEAARVAEVHGAEDNARPEDDARAEAAAKIETVAEAAEEEQARRAKATAKDVGAARTTAAAETEAAARAEATGSAELEANAQAQQVLGNADTETAAGLDSQ